MAQPARALPVAQLIRLGREHGLALPALDDLLDRSPLHPLRQRLVGAAAVLTLAALLDPGAHAHQHEGPEPVRLAQGGMERQPTAHRVADERTAGLDGGQDLVDALLEGPGAEVEARAPVALAQPPGHRLPGLAALHEAGHERDL